MSSHNIKNPTICPVMSLRDYMAKTYQIQHAFAKLIFVSLKKPNKSGHAQTLAFGMAKSGVYTIGFDQHSTHNTSASWHGNTKVMSAKYICKAGQWFSLTTTFGKFYQCVVLQRELQQWASQGGLSWKGDSNKLPYGNCLQGGFVKCPDRFSHLKTSTAAPWCWEHSHRLSWVLNPGQFEV